MQWQQEFPTIVRLDSLTDNLADARRGEAGRGEPGRGATLGAPAAAAATEY